MPLNPIVLKNELQTWMENPSADKAESVNAFCDAYEKYAEFAIATSGGILVLNSKPAMVASLMNIPTEGTPISGADLFALSISLFWVGAAFTPSIVSSTFVPSVLSSALLTTFLNLSPTVTAEQKAIEMTAALHMATLTVITVNNLIIPPVFGTVI